MYAKYTHVSMYVYICMYITAGIVMAQLWYKKVYFERALIASGSAEMTSRMAVMSP